MFNLFSKNNLIAGAVALALSCASAPFAAAQTAEYPSEPITLIVPYKAGGSTETLARVFARAMGDALGQPVIVQTRPGGGGAVGTTVLSTSDPDGYTLMLSGSDPLSWVPLTLEVEYAIDDFTYVSQISEYQQAIVAKVGAPYETFAELLEYSQANPGLNYADQNAMSRAFLNFIAQKEGIEWTGIPTKGGGEMVPFLIAGKVDFAWSGGIHGRYGEDMFVLASMNSERLAASPDAPSISETYGISMPGHMLITGPSGIPADVIATLEAAIETATQDPDFVDLATNNLLFPVKYVNSADLSADIASTIEGLQSVIEQTQ
jgi:tripartite-type tricarboxylate transporter receptor subunit TctC